MVGGKIHELGCSATNHTERNSYYEGSCFDCLMEILGLRAGIAKA